MFRKLLIAFLLLSSSLANAQWNYPITAQWVNKFKVDKIFWLNTSDTTGYSAALYPGALVYQQMVGDTSIYFSTGLKYEKVGKYLDTTSLSTRIDAKADTLRLNDSLAVLNERFIHNSTVYSDGDFRINGKGAASQLEAPWVIQGPFRHEGTFAGYVLRNTSSTNVPMFIHMDDDVEFTGHVSVAAATADEHAVRLGQLNDSLATISLQDVTDIDSVTTRAITVGDIIHDRNPLPGDPPHKWEVTTEGSDYYLTRFTNYSNTGGLANIHVQKARGSLLSPSAVLNNDYIASFGFRGFGTLNFAPSSASFYARAKENFTDSSHGTEVGIMTTAVGANAWYGRTHLFTFGTNGDFTSARGVLANKDDAAMLMTGLTSYSNLYLQFNNSTGVRRGYVGMFGTANQLVISADAGSSGVPVVRVINRMLVNTATDNGASLNLGGSISSPIVSTTGNLTLTAANSTVIVVNSAHAITLPSASTLNGAIFHIVNYNTGGNVTISSVNRNGSATTSLPDNAKWTVQSNGTSWYVIQD